MTAEISKNSADPTRRHRQKPNDASHAVKCA